jgi:Ni,Fe-hydrogenase III large subunit
LKGAVAKFTSGAALQATKAAEKVAPEGDLPGANQAYRKLTAELDRLKSALTEFSQGSEV